VVVAEAALVDARLAMHLAEAITILRRGAASTAAPYPTLISVPPPLLKLPETAAKQAAASTAKKGAKSKKTNKFTFAGTSAQIVLGDSCVVWARQGEERAATHNVKAAR
jgi:hypothetical protein